MVKHLLHDSQLTRKEKRTPLYNVRIKVVEQTGIILLDIFKYSKYSQTHTHFVHNQIHRPPSAEVDVTFNFKIIYELQSYYGLSLVSC